jgi:hypothetical protein
MNDELIRLSQKLDAVTLERDHWKQQAQQFEDELVLAREALARVYR